MKKFTFKGYRADADASKDAQEQKEPSREPLNPQQRRREQVRRAQKTHRERKEAYVASLETEVVQLRANETRILQETKTLYAEVRALKKLLENNGIPIPTSLQDTTVQLGQLDIQSPQSARNTPPEPSFTLNIVQEKRGWHRRKQIYIQKSPPQAQPEQIPGTQMGPLTNPPAPSQTGEGLSPLTSALVSTQSGSISLCLGDLDPTVVGMDFVLTLESPCLPHIDTADSWNAPSTSGHTLTVSASLLQYHPAQRGKRLNSPLAWQVPNTNIERLLELSRSIPLDEGELTPVQAWDYIRRQTQYAAVEMERWERLKEKLLGRIKCHGFGAVLDRDAFEDAVYEAFVVGRVF